MSVRLVLADDHPIFLRGLEQLLATEEDFDVVASCVNGDEALRAVHDLRPDILVLDLCMPELDGIEVLRELDRSASPTRVIVLAATLDEEQVMEAIRCGAKGMVLKEIAPRQLIQCVRKVHGGEQWLELRSAARALEGLLRNRGGAGQDADALTPREVELVRLVAAGLQNKEIAARLGITEGTVKVHLHAVYGKVRVGNRVSLMRWAERKRLV